MVAETNADTISVIEPNSAVHLPILKDMSRDAYRIGEFGVIVVRIADNPLKWLQR
jgi:hypothetical protein